MRRTDDIAWKAPSDPLGPGGANARSAAEIIRREIPISVVATGWDVAGVRAARQQHVLGLFDLPAQMADAIMLTDARVQAGLASRLSILGRPVDFRIPRKYRDSSLARECRDAFADAWPEMAAEAVMSELQRWEVMLGFGLAQNLWDFSGKYAVPHPLPWHPRYVYYHWLYQCFVAITLDGQEAIIPGDASWILHAPHGGNRQRGWMRGAAFALSPWWLGRAYGLRDWMRYSERHGLPMLKLKRPAVGDPYQGAFMRAQMANLGQEAVFDLPQNPPPALSFDVDLLEAKDTAHEGFRMLIEQCNQEITLALLYQTLTTSMPAEGGSSYAAARVHAGVLQGALEADARGLDHTYYHGLSRPFAAVNFGNQDIACYVVTDVTPFEDNKTRAQTFQQYMAGLVQMRTAGYRFKNPKNIRRALRVLMPGVDIGEIEAVEPVQIEAQAARAGAQVKPEGREDKAPSDSEKNEDEDKASLARIRRLMSRLDPRSARLIRDRAAASERAFFDGDERGVEGARGMTGGRMR